MTYKLYLFDQVGTTMPSSFLDTLQEKMLEIVDEIAAQVEETPEEVFALIKDSIRIKNTHGKDDPRFQRYLVFEEIGGLLLFKRGLPMELYDDVEPAFSKLKENGGKIAIFASGGIEYLHAGFGSTNVYGLIDLYFTQQEIGSKYDPETYRKIAEAADVRISEMLFITDRMDEVEGAVSGNVPAMFIDRSQEGKEEKEGFTVIDTLTHVL